MSLNKFIAGLSLIFSERLLTPKLLVAPSMRVGQQWLDAAARAGAPVINARAKTLSRLALDLAAPAMACALPRARSWRFWSPGRLPT